MVALCRQCHAPLTVADLGYDLCLSCHWQHIFDYAVDPERVGELRLALALVPGSAGRRARDAGRRLWTRVRLDGGGQVWCTVCGATLVDGWTQGGPGGPEAYVCAAHVDLAP